MSKLGIMLSGLVNSKQKHFQDWPKQLKMHKGTIPENADIPESMLEEYEPPFWSLDGPFCITVVDSNLRLFTCAYKLPSTGPCEWSSCVTRNAPSELGKPLALMSEKRKRCKVKYKTIMPLEVLWYRLPSLAKTIGQMVCSV